MPIPPKLLGLVKEIVQQLGLDVTFEYNDLVFVSDNPFILKCSDRSHNIDLYFNEDIEEEKAQTLMALIETFGEGKGLQISYTGAFCLARHDDGNIELELFNLTDE